MTGTWLDYDFPYIGKLIIPIDSYFSDGLKPPTSIYIYTYIYICDTKYDIIIVCCNHYQQLSHDMISYDMTWCQWNVMNAIEKVHSENELYGVLAWLSFFHHQTWDNDPTWLIGISRMSGPTTNLEKWRCMLFLGTVLRQRRFFLNHQTLVYQGVSWWHILHVTTGNCLELKPTISHDQRIQRVACGSC